MLKLGLGYGKLNALEVEEGEISGVVGFLGFRVEKNDFGSFLSLKMFVLVFCMLLKNLKKLTLILFYVSKI